MIKFIEIDEVRFGGYYVRFTIDKKECNLYFQSKKLLLDFCGYKWYENKSIEELENGMQATLDELKDYFSFQDLPEFCWGRPIVY